MSDYSGVASINITGGEQATGALLWTGRHIITAAHVLNDLPDQSAISISLNSNHSITLPQVVSYTLHPGWANNPSNYNNDIAIIELSAPVDEQIARYDIYRQYDELEQNFIRVGYSKPIDPNTGEILDSTGQFHSGSNRYDTTTEQINGYLGTTIQSQYQLSYDFDNGQTENDAWGQLLESSDTGTGHQEIFANPGDSGGPAFIDHQIAGIASFIFRYADSQNNSADINDITDSSYGELASDTRVSKYSNWIDSVIDENFQEPPPENTDAVDKFPIEGDSGTTTNYFLLQLGKALSSDASVSFETLDGTAKAGSDYLSTSGTAVIPAGETQIAIPVAIIGDQIDENNETFYLRVFDPVGGVFPTGISELKAERTIIDNDHNHTNPQSNQLEIVGTVVNTAMDGVLEG